MKYELLCIEMDNGLYKQTEMSSIHGSTIY